MEEGEFPNVHELFMLYNDLYFGGVLGPVHVEWSRRMTLCAGLCQWNAAGGSRAGGGSCRIALSEPLLQYRPVADFKNTLLHEMIHAFLFITKGLTARDGSDGHGPDFQLMMNAINARKCPVPRRDGAAATVGTAVPGSDTEVMDPMRPAGGYNITVYHTFHDEVDNCRRHIWVCRRCGNQVARSMNRPPSMKDCLLYRTDPAKRRPCHDPRCKWHSHAKSCGGEYSKIAEPEKKKKPKPSRTSTTKKKARKQEGKSKAAADEPKRPSHVSSPSSLQQTEDDQLLAAVIQSLQEAPPTIPRETTTSTSPQRTLRDFWGTDSSPSWAAATVGGAGTAAATAAAKAESTSSPSSSSSSSVAATAATAAAAAAAAAAHPTAVEAVAIEHHHTEDAALAAAIQASLVHMQQQQQQECGTKRGRSEPIDLVSTDDDEGGGEEVEEEEEEEDARLRRKRARCAL